MKSILILSLVFFAGLSQAESVKSKSIKKAICSSLESSIYDEDIALLTIDEEDCVKSGSFEVLNKTYKEFEGETYLSEIEIDYSYKPVAGVEIAALAEAVRVLTTFRGETKKSWDSNVLVYDVVDSRDKIQLIKDYMDSDETYDDLDVGNGDHGYYTTNKQGLEAIASGDKAAIEAFFAPEIDEEDNYCEAKAHNGYDISVEFLDSVTSYGNYPNGLMSLVESLKADGKLVHATSVIENNDEDSENCSTYTFEFMFSDGTVVYVSYSWTT